MGNFVELNKKADGEIDFSPSAFDEKPEIDVNILWEKITESVRRILAAQFTDTAKRVPRPHGDRLAFACPFCGDSHKDRNKKRGNIFTDSYNYHCFNGDCNTHVSLLNFLKKFKEIDNYTLEEKLFIRERVSTSAESSNTQLHVRAEQSIDALFSDEALKLAVPRELIMRRLRLQEIQNSRIHKYMVMRYQTHFQRFAFDPRRGNIYLFNLTKDENSVIGYQIKTFSKRTPYLTYKISSIHELLGILKDKNLEMLGKMDTISTTFGIMHLDLNRTVTVFEGPMDSFLFPNSVGVCSAKNDFPFAVEGIRYFYDNDKTGKEWALRKIEAGFSVFLWKKFLRDSELYEYESKIKDLNDLIILIKREKLKTAKLADMFSQSKYDLIWI